MMWFADFGATEHMSVRRDWFRRLKLFENENNKVRIGDGNLLSAVSVGDIDVKVKNSDGSFTIVYTLCMMCGMCRV